MIFILKSYYIKGGGDSAFCVNSYEMCFEWGMFRYSLVWSLTDLLSVLREKLHLLLNIRYHF